MDKKKFAKTLAKIGTGFVAFAGTLVGGYVIAPNKTRTIKLDFGNDLDNQVQDTYFNRFVNHVKNAASVDSEEVIDGLQASFEGFELTWGYDGGVAKNNIALNGDIQFKMANLNDLDFTIDLDANYNGKHVDLGVGIVDKSIYVALMDLKIKTTVDDDSEKNYTQQVIDVVKNYFFNPENEDGLGIELNTEAILDSLLNGFDISALTGGASTTIDISESDAGEDIVDTIAITMTKENEETNETETNEISIRFGFEKNEEETEEPKLKYIDLGTIKLGDFQVKGKINCTLVPDLKVYAFDDEKYAGLKKRTGFVEVINYIGWADDVLDLLKTRKAGLELSASLSLDGKASTDPTSKLADIHANVDFNLEDLFDLTGKKIDSINFDSLSSLTSLDTSELVQNILDKVAFGIDVSVKGQGEEEYANLGVHYQDNMGYLTLNEDEEENAVMRAKISTSTINSIVNKIPSLMNAIGGDENKENSEKLFDFITSSELVTAIQDGRYEGILDLIDTLKNDEKTITIGLNLKTLGLGANSKVTLVLDASKDANARVLNLDVEGVELGTVNLDLSLKTKKFSDERLNKVVANKDNFDELNYLPSVFDQVSSILDSKQAGFTVTGSILDEENLGIKLNGWGQFDYGEKYGYGALDIDQYKTSPTKVYAQHDIKIDVDNSGEVAKNKNVKFTYGPNDGIKGKFTVQTVLDIVDLVKTFIGENGGDNRFTKFIDPILESLGITYIGNIIKDKDFAKFASSDFIKEIKERDNAINIVINKKVASTLEEDIVIQVKLQGTGEDRTIAGLALPSLTVKGKTIKLGVDIKDFDSSKKTPVNLNYTFMDFSDIKVLLQFGINTTMQNYYHLKATAKIKALAIFNISATLDFHIYVDGEHTYVYGTVNRPGLIFESDTNTEFVFEPDSDVSGNDVGGYFHILRKKGSDRDYWKSTSKNFIDGNNLARYLIVDILGINNTLYNLFMKDDTSSKEKTAPEFENCLSEFKYSSDQLKWDLGLNIAALTGMDFLGTADLDIYGAEVNGKEYLSKVVATMKIFSIVNINATITLENAGSTAANWGTIQSKYQNVINTYYNLSSNQKTNFDNNYLNNPSKAWSL